MSCTPTTEAEWLIDAYARLLEARHDHAHNGDIVRLGPVDECEICVGGMRDFIGHVNACAAPLQADSMSDSMSTHKADPAA
jgi:hypothetical protein